VAGGALSCSTPGQVAAAGDVVVTSGGAGGGGGGGGGGSGGGGSGGGGSGGGGVVLMRGDARPMEVAEVLTRAERRHWERTDDIIINVMRR
jgi:hypothetical protein